MTTPELNVRILNNAAGKTRLRITSEFPDELKATLSTAISRGTQYEPKASKPVFIYSP